jgi:hypothetical protein
MDAIHGEQARVQQTVAVVVSAQRTQRRTQRVGRRIEQTLHEGRMQVICLQEIGAEVRPHLSAVLLQRGKYKCGGVPSSTMTRPAGAVRGERIGKSGGEKSANRLRQLWRVLREMQRGRAMRTIAGCG